MSASFGYRVTSCQPNQRVLPVILSLLLGWGLPLSASAEEASRTYTNPGWGNAAEVCSKPRIGKDSPRLAFRGGRNAFATGFYRIRRIPDGKSPQFLEVTAGADGTPIPVIRNVAPESARRWLMTQTGADIYQVSTCVEDAPLCLLPDPDPALASKSPLTLRTCEHEGIGTQAWWMIGLLSGGAVDGHVLGSDGLGRLTCLSVGKSGKLTVPRMAACEQFQDGAVWRIEVPGKVVPKQVPQPATKVPKAGA